MTQKPTHPTIQTNSSNTELFSDFFQQLKQTIAGDVRSDLVSRLLYSTDASIYQMEPIGVAFPQCLDDLSAIVEICSRYQVPVLARGAGSSLAGQAIGRALVVDCSHHLNHMVEIDPEAQTAIVEPGLVMAVFNRAAAKYGLKFGPDPASAERATMGGSLANNASGAHSILYGMSADHLISADVILADGSSAVFRERSIKECQLIAGFGEGEKDGPLFSSGNRGIEAALYRTALDIRENYSQVIRQNWPITWRRASGYGLNYLLPWSPTQPAQWSSYSSLPYPPVNPGHLNLAPILAGSEGTLAVIRTAKVRLVPIPECSMLGVMAFPSIEAACDASPRIMEHNPAAIELIPDSLVNLARAVPAYAQQIDFLGALEIDLDKQFALLVVEFCGNSNEVGLLRQKVAELRQYSPTILAESPSMQRKVWGVRKAGLGILMSQPGDHKPWSFIEDLAVPVESLGQFVRQMAELFENYGTRGEMYAHASAGCLHIRPLLELKTVSGIAVLREIAQAAVEITVNLGGAVSGEHGDGFARSEWLLRMYGEQITGAFQKIKYAADPQGLLNPGKIVSLSDTAPLPQMNQNLRFGPDYHARPWQSNLDFTNQAGIAGAIEQCNGAGVCRKPSGSFEAGEVMCPSFQATQEEMHSTRGRSNVLRAMISGRFPTQHLAQKAVYEAMDLCLACKGCKSECPSGVDIAKLKYEFFDHYYSKAGGAHRRKVRDYLFAYIGRIARYAHHLAPVINPLVRSRIAARLGDQFFGLTSKRKFPELSRQSLKSRFADLDIMPVSGEDVLFLTDAFSEYFYPEAGLSALQALVGAGCRPHILPVVGAGRTLISKGFIDAARQQALKVVKAVELVDPEGKLPIIGVEPSEIYTLCDEYLDLLPNNPNIQALKRRAFTIEEFLVRPSQVQADNQPRELRIAEYMNKKLKDAGNGLSTVLLHGHCYQKARPPAEDGFPVGVEATKAMLQSAGYAVQVIQSGCCGMAGAFGYETEHYDLSIRVGELALFPSIRKADREIIVTASGVSCRAQIEDACQRSVVHPITLIS